MMNFGLLRLTSFLILYCLPLISFAQVVVYDLTGQNGAQATQPPTSTSATITASDITRGPGVTAATSSGGTNSFNAVGWTSSSLDPNDYFEFTLTPKAGYQLDLTSISLSLRRTGTTINYQFVYSIGGGPETILSSGPASGATNGALVTANLSVSTTQPVRFRIYAWGGTAGNSFQIKQNITTNGQTAHTCYWPDVPVLSATPKSSN